MALNAYLPANFKEEYRRAVAEEARAKKAYEAAAKEQDRAAKAYNAAAQKRASLEAKMAPGTPRAEVPNLRAPGEWFAGNRTQV
jgi:hypothetical protein